MYNLAERRDDRIKQTFRGARDFFGDALRANNKLPERPDPQKVDKLLEHFRNSKSKITNLDAENQRLREEVASLHDLAGKAAVTLRTQRQQLDTFYSKREKSNDVPAADSSNDSTDFSPSCVATAGEASSARSAEEVSGEVLPAPVPDTSGHAD